LEKNEYKNGQEAKKESEKQDGGHERTAFEICGRTKGNVMYKSAFISSI
jgi:hypothetical protein